MVSFWLSVWLVLAATAAVRSQDACKSIVQAAAEDVRLAALRASMRASELEDMFASTNMTFTFLAPTNGVFWSPEVQARIAHIPFNATDPQLSLSLVIRGHVLMGALPIEALSSGRSFKTLAGVSVGVLVTPGGATRVVGGQNNAVITQANAVPGLCGGSLVHFVDNLISPDLSEWQCCSVLQGVQLLGAASETGQRVQKCMDEGDDMADEVQGRPFTLFAPINSAWQRVRDVSQSQYEGILMYHIVPGAHSLEMLRNMTTLTTLKGESITIHATPDSIVIGREGSTAALLAPQDSGAVPLQLCGGSQVHLIDNVLLPETFETCTPLPASISNIPEVSYLFQRVSSDALVDMLRGDQGYTLLIPSDEVISRLRAHPESLGVSIAQLTSAHIIVGAYRLEQLLQMNGQTVPTLNSTLKVSVSHGQVTFRSTSGDQADITSSFNMQGNVSATPFGKICGDSIAHVIDGVLRPAIPGQTLPPPATAFSTRTRACTLLIWLLTLIATLLQRQTSF